MNKKIDNTNVSNPSEHDEPADENGKSLSTEYDLSDSSDVSGLVEEALLEEEAESEDETEDDEFSETQGAEGAAKTVRAEHQVQPSEAGLRLDKLAAQVFEGFSRAQLQTWIGSGELTVNSQSQKPKYRVKKEDTLRLAATLQEHSEDLPEDIELDVIYEDDAVVVINKPVGMVVHPGAGNWTHTLVNALLFHYPEQRHLPRAGLVHRIDKDTSGLLIVGKTKAAQLHLMAQLKDKSVYRHYQCVVAGDEASLMRHRHIDAPIGRHRSQRTKMTVTSQGKDAVTHLIDITALAENYSLVDVALETGRTHQIRVHLSHIGYPLVGDHTYGGRQQLRAGLSEVQRQAVLNFPRQALHAYALGFIHPVTGEEIQVTAPLPEDIKALVAVLQAEAE